MRVIMEEKQDIGRTGKYPFTDESSLTAESGLVLPDGFIIDAQLYIDAELDIRQPIIQATGDYTGGFKVADLLRDRTPRTISNSTEDHLHLAEVDFGARKLTLRKGSAIIATGVWDNSGFARMYANTVSDRARGVIIVDVTKATTGVYRFANDSAIFAPSAVCIIRSPAIRSITLEDGTVLSGDIKLRGVGGVYFSWDRPGHNVFINAVTGFTVSSDPDEDCDSRPNIERIAISSEQVDFVLSVLSGDDSTILIDNENGLECPGGRYSVTALDDPDPCEEDTETETPETEDPVSLAVILTPKQGRINMSPAAESPIQLYSPRNGVLVLTVHGKAHNSNGYS